MDLQHLIFNAWIFHSISAIDAEGLEACKKIESISGHNAVIFDF